MAKFDLVFEGGGAKGSTFVGALKAFQEKGHTHRRLLGTSAGAITASLLAAGFSPDEMRAATTEKLSTGQPVFSSFMDAPAATDFSAQLIADSDTLKLLKQIDIPLVPNAAENWVDLHLIKALLDIPVYRSMFNFVECGGLYSGEAFRKWLAAKLALKGYAADITLEQFYAKNQVDLSMVSSDTDAQMMRVFNFRTAPKLPLVWAIRMSMSIPLVWREVVWDSSWGTYLGENLTGHRFVDGGVLSNFPIALVDTQPAPGSEEEKIMGNTPAQGAGTLGLLIDENIPVPGQESTPHHGGLQQLKVMQRIHRLIDTMSDAQDNAQIHAHANLVCHLPAKGYGTTEFDMAGPRLDALVNAGYAAMLAYLAQHT